MFSAPATPRCTSRVLSGTARCASRRCARLHTVCSRCRSSLASGSRSTLRPACCLPWTGWCGACAPPAATPSCRQELFEGRVILGGVPYTCERPLRPRCRACLLLYLKPARLPACARGPRFPSQSLPASLHAPCFPQITIRRWSLDKFKQKDHSGLQHVLGSTAVAVDQSAEGRSRPTWLRLHAPRQPAPSCLCCASLFLCVSSCRLCQVCHSSH